MTEEDIEKLADLIAEKMQASNKEILTAEEAAQYTGLKKSYLYKLTMNRGIPHSKPLGKMCYFRRTDLDQWMMRNPVKTEDEIRADADRYLSRSSVHIRRK